jgi:putative tryptophan/tyrosine transport system substrate-binding protein
LAADLVRRRVAVIATLASTPASLAAKAATTSIPIVFAVAADPVALGLVASLNRPGGNATGVSFQFVELVPKQLGMLRELVPGANHFAALVNPSTAFTDTVVKDLQAGGALLVGPDPSFTSRRAQIVSDPFCCNALGRYWHIAAVRCTA